MSRMQKFIIEVDGLRTIYYRLGSGPLLLFLHGGRSQARTYTKILHELANGYTVIAPDIPGYGESDTPDEDWSYVEYAAFFDDFLLKLNLEGAIVMGYSMGGGIAAVLAAVSSNVNELILIDAAGVKNTLNKPSHHDLKRLWFYLSHPRYFQAFFSLFWALINYTWKHKHDRKRINKIRASCFLTSYERYFSRIKVPTQLLWGDHDQIYPIDIARKLQAQIPHSMLEVVPGTHDWPLYTPSTIAPHVARQRGSQKPSEQ